MTISGFTLHELECFDAVVRAGGFQAAAALLHRSHPAVHAAVGKLERQLGVALLDRSGYRVRPTAQGLSFHRQAALLLGDADALQRHARQLAMGTETQLQVVIGDLCPRPQVLALLGEFFARHPDTRLNLHYEAVAGPWERLLDDRADLAVHRADTRDARLEWIDLGAVSLVPVAAPGFLPFPVTRSITPERMRRLTQCILRDSATRRPDRDHYVVQGAPQCTVADHAMKKELIVGGMAWGHLPRFMIEEELRDGRLVSLAGRHFPGIDETLAAVRRRDRPHGPIAEALWDRLRRRSGTLLRARAATARSRRGAGGARPARPHP
ncbi:LysR family transcriptional regulator [Luteimonas sp. RD2P54]|uniref:LysR family transcriptional regulator n=1 Tax=Luteimonas endophytica TaxID=3042023 RepID=A0ABT6JA03_9GAMM|nr:LysR family transcriptional regulator [Luteimonas endophytica]MDH5823651.1 LysR family transcriptional regulator [Luteimonas endophytica]